MKPVDLFSRDVHTFWATTFQFDLKLFDQFLLRRLGNQPLNAVVLGDEDNLTEALLGLTEVDRHVAASANRRYLLRGMRLLSGGRFHPKTYFFSSRRRTVLLVGSGNLTRSGLDRGREVFCAYEGSDEADVGVIRAWATWLGELVTARSDEQLRRRYDHLRAVISGLKGSGENGELVSNRSQPLIDAIERAAPAEVDDVHVTAPYFDEHAEALSKLLERLRPEGTFHLYLGARTNVDGAALRGTLERAPGSVAVHRFEPDQFVHGKLIGITGLDGAGVLVCGSANLSHAALTRTYDTPGSWANCEVVVLRHGMASEVTAAFVPPDTTLKSVALDAIAAITFEYDETPPANPPTVRLLTAELAADGHIRVVTAREPLDELGIGWDRSDQFMPLDTGGRTIEPLGEESQPLIVWLVDRHGERCSNGVVLDATHALDNMLGEQGGATDRPVEIADEDERSELVSLLSWAHRQFIFDLHDTPAVRRANNAQEGQADEDDTGFWERYVRDELTYDTRSQTYRPLSSARNLAPNDLLLREIEAMLKAAPHERRLRVVRDGTDADGERGTGHAWSYSARERLRARNLLRRWARALADPRHAWLAPDAPATNYTALLDALTLIWLGEALEDDRIAELLGEVWSAFLGAGGRKGFLDSAEEDIRVATLGELSEDTCQLAAGLAYSALRPNMPWTNYIYDWQPFLRRGIELGLFAAGSLSSDLIAALWDDEPAPTPKVIEDLLLERAEWVDDAKWGTRMAAELGLLRVSFLSPVLYKGVSLVVAADGLQDPARDSRTVVLARRAMALKHSDNVLIRAGEERILLRLGTYARARVEDRIRSSVVPIDSERLRAVEQQGGSLAELLGLRAA